MSTSSSSPSVAGSDTTTWTTSASPTTSTTSSTPSTYKDSDSLPWILYHIIEAKIPCELPLRIMFSFNAGQKLPTLKNVNRWWQYETQGKLITQFFDSLDKINPSTDDTSIAHLRNPSSGPTEQRIDPDHCPYDRFMDHGNDSLLNLDFAQAHPTDTRQSQKGLPAAFILSTCKRIFPKEYEKVEFGHALTALDYLRDLEITRRDRLRTTAARLGITRETWRTVLADNPDAFKWVELAQKYELMIEQGYAAIFVDIRIWTMVAELKSVPFYKPNVLAMLNTLFPPSIQELPNDRIVPKVLHQYRSTFYRYITAVEANGSRILNAFEDKLQKDDNRHSWKSTWDNLQGYIELAELMIKQADAVLGIETFEGDYTYSSPLAKRDRLDLGILSSSGSTPSEPTASDVTFASSFEGPTTRIRTPKLHGSSFTSSEFRSHSRSRTNTNDTASTSFERPNLPQSARQSPNASFVALSNSSVSSLKAVPSLPKLDTDSIRNRQRAVSKPVMPFVRQDSPAAQHEAFFSPIILADPRKKLQERRRNFEARRPSTSHGEGAPKVEDASAERPSTSNEEKPRPSTSNGQERSSLSTSKEEEQPRPSTSNGQEKSRPSTANAQEKPHTSTSNGQDNLLIPDFKRLRTVSFYDAHMDSPSMPPPLTLGNKKLPSDGGAFLNRPYEERPPMERSIRKKPSFSRLFQRKNSEPIPAAEEGVFDEPNALGISTTPTVPKPVKPIKPILKPSKSMDHVQQTPNDTPDTPVDTPVLRTHRSFGESLRAKFKKSAESSPQIPSKDGTDPKADGVKKDATSKDSKDSKTPKTPVDLNSPHFQEFPEFQNIPGYTMELWEPLNSKKDRIEAKKKGGKYGQGAIHSPDIERPQPPMQYPDLKDQIGFEEPKPPKPGARARAKLMAMLIKEGLRKPEPKDPNADKPKEPEFPKKIPMKPIIVTTTEQRLGPILSEFKQGIETGEEYERFIVVAEGFGEEDEPTPSDLGDAIPPTPSPGRLRPTKSMGDLKSDKPILKYAKNDLNRPVKVMRKLMKKKVTGTLISPSDISSPIQQSLPEWEETLNATISKEHTRKWLMEEARARKRDLIKPKGKPVNKDIPKKRLQQRKNPYPGIPLQPKRVRLLREPALRSIKEFEEPRATPMPPQVPWRERTESIFAVREPPPPPPPPPARNVTLDETIRKIQRF